MGSLPVHYVDVRTFCYGTECEDRVVAALQTILPEETEVERASSEGHHGDEIVVLSARIENAQAISTVLEGLGEASVLTTVADELDERVTENCEFFLQLDKQAALDDDMVLGDGIKVRVKVESYPATREGALDNASTMIDKVTV